MHAMVAHDLVVFVQETAKQHGLRDLRLVRDGWNAVFDTSDGVVLRVGQPRFSFDDDVRAAEVLREHGVSTPRVLFRAVRGDRAVTGVERIEAVGSVEWTAVGEQVARLHRIPTTLLELPSCTSFPHWQFTTLLADLRPVLDAQAFDALYACHERWSDWQRDALDHPVMCHGDVQPGNVIPTASGPVLIDLDLRCTAPAAYDHAALLTWEHRWNGAPGTYEAFAAGYGSTFVDSRIGRQFAELRLLAATLMRVRAAQAEPAAEPEASLRLRWWRGEPDAPRWTPQ